MISSLQVFRPGVGWLWADPGKVTLAPGDVLRVSVAVPYRGPEHTFTLYASIGQRGLFGFDEILVARAPLACPDSPERFTTVTGDVDIQIIGTNIAAMGGISPGTDYDLSVKIEEKPEVRAEVSDVIDIASAPSPWQEMFGMMGMLVVMGLAVSMVGEGMG